MQNYGGTLKEMESLLEELGIREEQREFNT